MNLLRDVDTGQYQQSSRDREESYPFVQYQRRKSIVIGGVR